MAGEGKRLVVAIVSIIVIVACVIVIARWTKKTGQPSADVYQVKGICQNCGEISVHKLKGAPDWPLVCPDCKQRAVWKLYKCRECGYEFPKKPGEWVSSCPKCGSPKVGAAD